MLKKGRRSRREVLPTFMIVLKMNSSCIQKIKRKHKRKFNCKVKKRRCRNRRRKRRVRPVFLNRPKRFRKILSFPITFPTAPCLDPVYPVNPVIPVNPVNPINPINPVKPCKNANDIVIEKECCGNVLIQGKQPEFLIWEADVDSQTTIAQISIFSDAASTDALNVDINGDELKRIIVLPGNTSNFIGQGVKSVRLSVQGNDFTYVEGKYVISTTLQLSAGSSSLNGQ
ncbi:S-Ena type endospore appendage [Paenibacillus sp. FSL H8-0537]|uniref:S-Ena type endospore appendage n=1 Tax=Paenibacillus sp. FSL H8-0537 TaxID=2921399 RepID=UPI003100C608